MADKSYVHLTWIKGTGRFAISTCCGAPAREDIFLIDRSSQIISLTADVCLMSIPLSPQYAVCSEAPWLTGNKRSFSGRLKWPTVTGCCYPAGIKEAGVEDWADWRWIPTVTLHSSMPDYLKRWAMFETMSLISHTGLCLFSESYYSAP